MSILNITRQAFSLYSLSFLQVEERSKRLEGVESQEGREGHPLRDGGDKVMTNV